LFILILNQRKGNFGEWEFYHCSGYPGKAKNTPIFNSDKSNMLKPIQFSSNLSGGEESIFSKMNQMVRQYAALDLSQGFPNFKTDDKLKTLVNKAMLDGHNQYAPMPGVGILRERIAAKIALLHGKEYDPETEITVTSGATEALYSAITAFVNPGDEVIVFKPAYDSYEPTIKLSGGEPVLIELDPVNFKIDWKEVKKKISSRTRMIIINSPHNPTGSVLEKDDMLKLQALMANTNILLLSDEVYEHLIFDDHRHYSASSFPGLAERAIVCASFGKTFHNTGWKTGYCVAPKELMSEIRKIHQFVVFCVNHPVQHAFAEYLEKPDNYLHLGEFYQQKRDYFLKLIGQTRFKAAPSAGTYFQVLDYSDISLEPDTAFAERLVREYGLACIPVSVFNINKKDNKQLRFCFAKTDETLEKAAEILRRVN
jgi:methionine aminotransferase